MFIVTSVYQKPSEFIDRFLAPHRAFLDTYIGRGIFVAAGRKVPRVGGAILAKGCSREELVKIMEEDPFSVEGIARYEIVEVELTRIAPGFEALG